MPIDIIQAVILAIIQGITEWLPVSSSAHLGLAQIFMHAQTPLIFDILLHVGTLFAAVVYFREELFGMAQALLKFDKKSRYFRMALLILLASIPTAIIGFAFHDYFASMFFSLFWIGITLIINAAFMLFCEHRLGNKKIGKKSALLMGVAQGISISPGISRSGATIGTALLLGVGRDDATRFSFIMSIPAILGATIFEWRGGSFEMLGLEIVLISLAISAIVGYLSIDFMIKFVRRRGLKPFANYCLLIGALALIASIIL